MLLPTANSLGNISPYIYIYIYIYIYNIIRVLVVTKSLCGYVSNQVQYDKESAQYLGLSNYIYIYIYTFNPWKIVCDPGFHGVFCKTTIIRQLRRGDELKIENTKKYRQKTVRISFMCGCKCVSVCGCVRICVCVILTYWCVCL